MGKRPDILPADYSCDTSKCQPSLCKNWKDAKCRKDCYCQQCHDQLNINDYRCATYKEDAINPDCDCAIHQPIECNTGTANIKLNEAAAKFDTLKIQAKDISSKLAKAAATPKDCFTRCYCNKCFEKFNEEMKEQCDKNRKLSVTDCSCPDLEDILECPSADNLKQLLDLKPEYEKLRNEALNDAAEELKNWEDMIKEAKALSKERKNPENRK